MVVEVNSVLIGIGHEQQLAANVIMVIVFKNRKIVGKHIKLIRRTCVMGCDPSTIKNAVKPIHHSHIPESKVGVLEVKIKNIFLHQIVQSTGKQSDLIVRLQVSNQFEQLDLDMISTTPGEQTNCKFFINSRWKEHGRTLTMQVWNVTTNDNKVGFGVFDLEPFLNPKKKRLNSMDVKKAEKKCYLNYEHKPGGFIEVQPIFKEQRFTEISFKLFSAQIRKPNPSVKNCFVRIIVGEQIHESELVHLKNHNQIIWFGDEPIVTFRVPETLETGVIQLIARVGNNDNLLGYLSLDLKMLSLKEEKIDEDLVIEEDGQITGSLTMLSIPSLKQIPTQNLQSVFELPSPRKRRKDPRRTSITNMLPLQIVQPSKQAQLYQKIHNQQTRDTIQSANTIYVKSSKFQQSEGSTKKISLFPPPKNTLPLLQVPIPERSENQNDQKVQYNPESAYGKAVSFVPGLQDKNAEKKSSKPPEQIRQALASLKQRRVRKKSMGI